MTRKQLQSFKQSHGHLKVFSALIQAAESIINQREKSLQTEVALASLNVTIKKLILQESRP